MSKVSEGISEPTLAELRASLDNLDAALVMLLAERFKLTDRVGRLKKALRLPAADPEREAAQLSRIAGLAAESGLAADLAVRILRLVIDEVVQRHGRIGRAGSAA